ncbi:sporulation-delaying protein SdpB family protein [Micromonospora sp. NBC_01638]|uniref:sporulation-delaying protein SdpB family protein n=1 Tax=Micromonospora sp. NBC_01638 TaxID=2975982 RepID=UPI00386AA51D|nr:DCC1-like thiol-disulfide oxidoreductase family protein [Micromonospora sp. NBC_01638]
MLTRFGRWARPQFEVPVWSSGIGLARTLLALGTLGTMLATDPIALMSPLANGIVPPVCNGIAQAGIWCVTPNLAAGRWLSVVVLLVVASGWRPRITALPHWYVSWSLVINATVQDGGDQATTVLTLLLMPICLTDPRRWHWKPLASTGAGQDDASAPSVPSLARITARMTLLLIQIQVAVLYLQASVAKLGVEEWANGTALFYWSSHPGYGSPPWLRPVTDLITHSPFGVVALTWGTVALEFALALGIVLSPAARRVLLPVGLLFHAAIALDMGLVSFWAAMSGALLLYLLPVGHHVRWPARLGQWVAATVRRPGPPSPPAAPGEPAAPGDPDASAAPDKRTPAEPVPQASAVAASTVPDRYLFVYDGDCGFCAASVHFAQRRLRPAARGVVNFAPWRSVDLARYGLTSYDVRWAAYLIRPDGGRLAGAAAFAQLARYGRGAWPLLGYALRWPPGSWLAAGSYRLVAVHRHRLPGGSVACLVVPD